MNRNKLLRKLSIAHELHELNRVFVSKLNVRFSESMGEFSIYTASIFTTSDILRGVRYSCVEIHIFFK